MAAASVQVLRSATLMGPDELGTALKGPEELGTAPSRRSLSRAGSRGFPSTRSLVSPAGAQGKRAGERRDDSPLASSQGHVSEVHPSPSRHPSPDGVPASGRPGMQASSADARPPLDSSASSVPSAYFGGVARRMQSPPSTPPASAYASLGGGGMCASTRSVGASSPRDGASAQRDGGVEGGRRGRPTGTCQMTPTDHRVQIRQRSASESKLGNSSAASESGKRPPNGFPHAPFPHAPSQPRGGSRTGSRETARDAVAEQYAYSFGALSTLVGPDPRPCLACKCSPRRPCPLPHRWARTRRRFGS